MVKNGIGNQINMNKSIFNSLGSNYTWQFAGFSLWSWISAKDSVLTELKQELMRYWPGEEIVLTAKGRDALELAIRGLRVGIGEIVLTQAFSCVAVEEAIIRAGARPVYYDLAPDCLFPSLETISRARQQLIDQGFDSRNIKALILQFSLGVLPDLEAITDWCQKNQIKLVIDLAQSAGAKDKKNKLIGNGADAIAFSFGRDKILDAVSGGAVIFSQSPKINLSPYCLLQSGSIGIFKDATYPIMTWIIRQSFGIGFGMILLKTLKIFKWFNSPVLAEYQQPSQMHPFYAQLAVFRLRQIEHELIHRRLVAGIYHQKLAKYALLNNDGLKHGANQRYPLIITDPSSFIKYMKKHHVYLSDRWYRAPVDSGSLARPSVYQLGSCPNAEKTSQHIINLPTHINICSDTARKIADLTLNFISNYRGNKK